MIGRPQEIAVDIGRALQAQIDAKRGHLAQGLAEDFPDYRHRVGEIAGLSQAVTIVETCLKDLMENRHDR